VTPRSADQFLTAVHRRRLLAAGFDTAAWAIGVAAVAATGLVFITSGKTAALLAVACFIITLVWMAMRQPNRFQTAVELDRQLQTDDLLSTALFSDGGFIDGDFARVVIASADNRFANVDASRLAARRIGIRGWSLTGIAVATAVVMVLRPRAVNPNATAGEGSSLMTDPIRLIALNERSQTAGPSGPRSPRITSEEGTSKIGGTEIGRTAAAGSQPNTADEKRGHANGGSTGGGPGQSQTKSPVENRLNASGNGATSGGDVAGDGHVRGTAGAAVAAGTQGADAAASAASPWQSSGWARARAEASTAVSSGVVPARARSLVRDYFDGE
jgi:hypothetical protein